MGKILNVLIIDDHPVIIGVFKSALAQLNKKSNITFKISEAVNCDQALQKIDQALKTKPLDLVFLDINLPPSKKKRGFVSGEDIGEEIRVVFPNAKIIVFTSNTKNLRLNSIFTNVNPEGFLIKVDVTLNDITKAIETILLDAPYYSKTVLQLIRKQISKAIVIDKIDRQILYELSIGTKMKDLPALIPLSMAGIERRKRLLKCAFNVIEKDDKVLITVARENGFL